MYLYNDSSRESGDRRNYRGSQADDKLDWQSFIRRYPKAFFGCNLHSEGGDELVLGYCGGQRGYKNEKFTYSVEASPRLLPHHEQVGQESGSMRYKVFLHDKSHVERQIGFNLLTLNHALELADEAQKRFSHLDILSIEIYKLEASFPFQVPADALNTSDSSAIPATQESLK